MSIAFGTHPLRWSRYSEIAGLGGLLQIGDWSRVRVSSAASGESTLPAVLQAALSLGCSLS